MFLVPFGQQSGCVLDECCNCLQATCGDFSFDEKWLTVGDFGEGGYHGGKMPRRVTVAE